MAFNYFEITREFDDARFRKSWIFTVAVREIGAEMNLLLESFEFARWDDDRNEYVIDQCAYNAREFAEIELELPPEVEQELRRRVCERMINCEIVCLEDCRNEDGRRTDERSFVVLANPGESRAESLPAMPPSNRVAGTKITGAAVYFAPKPTGH